MGQKDTTEKLLMDYNDVFADVVNGLLCKGEQVVQPCDLVMSQPISQYKVDGKIHEMERDVCKYWKPGNVRIALYGLENQTRVENFMPFRIIARFFVEKRKNPNYIPEDPMEIEHVDEFLKLMAVLTGDNRYVDILRFEGKEIVSMCDVAARLENIGLQKGLAEGDLRRLIKQTCKKMQTLLSAEEIADDLAEDDVALIQKIMDAAKEFAPEYDIDAIYEKVAK